MEAKFRKVKSTYKHKGNETKGTGGGPPIKLTGLETMYEEIFGWQANNTGITGEGLEEIGISGTYGILFIFFFIVKSHQEIKIECSLILKTFFSLAPTHRMIPANMTGQSQIMTEDPSGHHSENQRYIEMQDPRQKIVFTQPQFEHFDAHKNTQLFASTQQTSDSINVINPSENALTPSVPSVRQNQQFKGN